MKKSINCCHAFCVRKIILSEFAVGVFQEFLDISEDANEVASFFTNAAEYHKTKNFHGIDLNWENLEQR